MTARQQRRSRVRALPARGLCLAIGAASLTCNGPEDDAIGTAVAVSDSAGVRVVTNAAADRPLAIRRSLRIGVVEGDPDFQFDRIRTLAVDSAGGIWVSDSHESIRHYSASGEYVGRVGRRGEGPGEAPGEGYGDVWLGHGTVLALAYEPTLQLFRPDGRFIGSRIPLTGPGGYLVPLGPADSQWMLRLRRLPERAAGRGRMRWTVGRGPVTGPGFDSLFTKAGPAYVSEGGGRFSNGSFFDGNPALRGDAHGNVYYSDAMEYRIEVYDSSGTLRQIVSRSVPSRPYSQGLEDEIEDAVRDALTNGPYPMPATPERVAQLTAQALPGESPQHLPFLESLLVSWDGFVWAQRADAYPRPAVRAVAGAFGYIRSVWPPEWRAPWVFDLFTPDGAYRGTVEAPSEFVPLAVSRDDIFGFVRDELDVQYIVRYSIDHGVTRR